MPPECTAGVARWDLQQQPTLDSLFGTYRGVSGVRLGASVSMQGLQAQGGQGGASLQELVDLGKLPLEELTVEVWAVLLGGGEGRGPGGGGEGALAGIIYKESGFLGKGWYMYIYMYIYK